MRILITGATGFVGEHLLRLLAQRRHQVFGTYLIHPAGTERSPAELLRCDIRRRSQVVELVRHVRPERVYHLAGLSSVTKSFSESRAVWQTNFWGAMNMLEAVRDQVAGARVLLVGSGQCYGRADGRRSAIAEDAAFHPESPYAASKAAADLLGQQFARAYGLQVVCARPFNHTGPGQPANFVCSDFARQFAAIELGLASPVLRVGNVKVRRDFQDVRDVVRAYALLMDKGEPGQAYNVSSGRAVSLHSILTILRGFSSRPVRIEVESQRLRRGEAGVLFGCNRKLRECTGWQPRFDLTTTLSDLFRFWKNQLSIHAGSSGGRGAVPVRLRQPFRTLAVRSFPSPRPPLRRRPRY